MNFPKHRLGLMLLLTLCPQLQPFQLPLNTVAAVAPIPSAETLVFNVEWRLIAAGKAHLQFATNGNGFSASVHMESSGLISKFFKVEDDYSSELDPGACAPIHPCSNPPVAAANARPASPSTRDAKRRTTSSAKP